MDNAPLANYLKTLRLQTGLTHEEVAFLLGGMSGTSVSRHENGHQLPILRAALAYQFIFGVPMHAVYEGVFHDVRAHVCERARGMRASFRKKRQTKEIKKKLQTLDRLLAAEDLEEAA